MVKQMYGPFGTFRVPADTVIRVECFRTFDMNTYTLDNENLLHHTGDAAEADQPPVEHCRQVTRWVGGFCPYLHGQDVASAYMQTEFPLLTNISCYY